MAAPSQSQVFASNGAEDNEEKKTRRQMTDWIPPGPGRGCYNKYDQKLTSRFLNSVKKTMLFVLQV
ncbi:hypothetical protein GCM10023333_02540 [Ferrimonas pelagia]|uniref:Uncharacterized protein n=1 Tax=Ferrimonas pelagia TaxID=1177826 RepID=A0ABP9EFD7_9GAMM